ncbi:phosphoenolpyruvate--protein phosphotransferase [Microbacterium sp. YMB-B2]|uniref:Phosphoenolpyruvate-protein phosphotransferase n=1 Tax=Microbacterium tenebrionis TaxID=2830665 RepID=A0A9X1LQZ7_9MICO|nr:phosphoenolpyruvate--protein phosphotransferase [Microbacterium tenebrionis]MCC2030141.1 phosphoenolpyruvate--protein phosphotransferase [Microbacterium tenebrionis]
MTEIRGVGIGQGVAQGPVVRMAEALPAPEKTASAAGADAERTRAREAVAAVAAELQERAETAGGAAQEVLEAQAMIAEDPTLQDEVDARIDDGGTAEWAVHDAFAGFKATLEAVGGYLGERAADLDDIAQRVLAHLRGVDAPGIPDPGHPFVLVARDLAPADTALLKLDQVLALITTDGGPTSHTAILAREKGIVAVVGAADAASLENGQQVIVDAAAGTVTTDPSAEELERAQVRADARAAAVDAPPSPGALADGTKIALLANLGKPADAAEAVARGAEGVGLFRTEFLFLSASQAPTVAEQRTSYRDLLSAFPGKKVVVRMLDAGADKPLAFLNDAHEENPALGLRGLRSLRASEDILREQLTALAEADAETEADLWVMAPMVTTVEETKYFTGLAREYGLKTAGVMVEVPASALLADRVLAHADFASIGTNDLTQYTMAADRMLGSVALFQNPWHPAVLRLVGEVGAAGARTSKPVGVCGEAAADPLLALVLVGLGVTSLSMAPAALADVRLALSERTLDETRRLAEIALAADDAAGARNAVAEAFTDLPSHQKETTS